VPTSTAGSRLAGVTFTDPQHEPGWRHVPVPASNGRALPSEARDLAVEVVGAGTSRGLAEWVEETSTTSLLVLDEGTIVHEWYAEGLGPETLFLGASMTKSVLAHLVGRAVSEGALALTEEVINLVPELSGTGYDGTCVLDVLTMTTGVEWVEDHRDPDSLASRLLGRFATSGDSRALLREVGAGVAPGIRFSYCTADSQVLDWVRARATGRAYPEDVARLWRDLGCGSDAAVAVDGTGVAMAGGGLAATARDWARMALLAVDGGGLLEPDWVESAARPTYPFLAPGRLPSNITTHAGFGYHWWPMDADGERLTADGSRGQFACVDRGTGAVVVKTSQWPYDDFLVDRQARDLSYLGLHALLDALAEKETSP
jgi:CubicO group peptidase (beta-lactamase class C family)